MFAGFLVEHGVECASSRLADIDIHPCTGCEACRTTGTCTRFSDGMNDLYPVIERSVGLVLASPTYNYTITPETKTFIDRLYPYFDFVEPRPGPYVSRLAGQGRKLVAIGICEQHDPADMRYTLPVMSDAMSVIGYHVVDQVAITGHFDAGSVGNDDGARRRVFDATLALARAIGAAG